MLGKGRTPLSPAGLGADFFDLYVPKIDQLREQAIAVSDGGHRTRDLARWPLAIDHDEDEPLCLRQLAGTGGECRLPLCGALKNQ